MIKRWCILCFVKINQICEWIIWCFNYGHVNAVTPTNSPYWGMLVQFLSCDVVLGLIRSPANIELDQSGTYSALSELVNSFCLQIFLIDRLCHKYFYLLRTISGIKILNINIIFIFITSLQLQHFYFFGIWS